MEAGTPVDGQGRSGSGEEEDMGDIDLWGIGALLSRLYDGLCFFLEGERVGNW